MIRLTRIFLIGALLAGVPHAMAAVTCTAVTSTGFSTAFSGTVPPNNITAATVSVTCNRNLVGDPTTQNYSIGTNNGAQPTGQNNRAVLAGNFIRYDLYKDAACGTTWKSVGGGGPIAESMTLTGFLPTTKVTNYWGCILISAAVPAGTYADTLTFSVTWNGTTGNASGGMTSTITNAAIPVNIATPATCAISTAPGTLSFTYTALGAAQTASTLFRPTCTIYLPYTISLSANVAVAVGLNYELKLNTVNTGGTNTLAATGTGALQTFYINGTMAAGQAGTCVGGTCNASNLHTLTITY
jgi:spore coat protein U-like protein